MIERIEDCKNDRELDLLVIEFEKLPEDPFFLQNVYKYPTENTYYEFAEILESAEELLSYNDFLSKNPDLEDLDPRLRDGLEGYVEHLKAQVPIKELHYYSLMSGLVQGYCEVYGESLEEGGTDSVGIFGGNDAFGIAHDN